MTARLVREPSSQPAAVRKRRQRERQRLNSVPLVTPPAPAKAEPLVTPAPAGRDVTPEVTPIASSALLETVVVKGPGADAFMRPTVLGVTEATADAPASGGTPLVTPPPPPPPPTTTPNEAKMIAAAVMAYCKFGWTELANGYQHELDALAPRPMQAALMQGGLEMVGKSAEALAIKWNVRIPYGDEATVGLGVGLASVGLWAKFKKPANENTPPARDVTPKVTPDPRDSRDHAPVPPVTRDVTSTVIDAEVIDDAPTVRVTDVTPGPDMDFPEAG